MSDFILFETERLIIRNWREADKPLFAKIGSDPVARKYFPDVMSREYAYDIIDRDREMIAEKKYGWCALELKQTNTFIGMIGLIDVGNDLPFFYENLLEIGWYLDPDCWGKGYASEGALAMLGYAWSTFNPEEIVAFTAAINTPSERVMQRIGMHRDLQGDFEHPKVDKGHLLKPHLLYRIQNPNKKGR